MKSPLGGAAPDYQHSTCACCNARDARHPSSHGILYQFVNKFCINIIFADSLCDALRGAVAICNAENKSNCVQYENLAVMLAKRWLICRNMMTFV